MQPEDIGSLKESQSGSARTGFSRGLSQNFKEEAEWESEEQSGVVI